MMITWLVNYDFSINSENNHGSGAVRKVRGLQEEQNAPLGTFSISELLL